METRALTALDRRIAVIGTGTWQLGLDQGEVAPETAAAALEAAVDAGVTLIDTADVYGDGRSERFVSRFLAAHPDAGLTIATKMGRRAAQTPESYTREGFLAWNDRSRANLGVETIDLVQLHCPPGPVIEAPRTWQWLDEMVEAGRIRAYGVSVQTCEQALEAIGHPGCASVELIVNVFRQRPLDAVLPAARAAGTAVIARTPLPEGLLTHNRRRNAQSLPRPEDAPDLGRIFTVVPGDAGARAARELARLCRELGPEHVQPVQVALRWLIEQEGITCILPDARSAHQMRFNIEAAGIAPLGAEMHAALAELYDRIIRPYVHDRW